MAIPKRSQKVTCFINPLGQHALNFHFKYPDRNNLVKLKTKTTVNSCRLNI